MGRDGELIIYRCKECGAFKDNIGGLHAHVETHRGVGPWNLIQIPFTKTSVANVSELMKRTEVLRANEYEVIDTNDFSEVMEMGDDDGHWLSNNSILKRVKEAVWR